MSVKRVMCALSKKQASALNSCKAAKGFIFLAFARIKTETNVLLYSISEVPWVRFRTNVQLTCLRSYCLEQS